MTQEPFREMLPEERALVRALLARAFPGRDQLARQLETAKVRTIDEDGSLELSIDSGVRLDEVKYVVPSEGEYEDPDGVTVHVLLYVQRDKVRELEFYREDGSCVRTRPDPENLRVFAPE